MTKPNLSSRDLRRGIDAIKSAEASRGRLSRTQRREVLQETTGFDPALIMRIVDDYTAYERNRGVPTMTRTVEVINIAPSWADVVPLLLEVIENGNAKGRAAARAELIRMATIADAYVQEHKGDRNAAS